MPRPQRKIEAGMIYHVLNRGNSRRGLFSKPEDFDAFMKLLGEALERFPIDLLAYCLMGNHWHLLLRPRTDEALSRCMAWLTVTHARRHHQHYPKPGTGHLYQGRFKSFPVQSDEHFLAVARYIHANPVKSEFVDQAQDWAWSDLSAKRSGADDVRLASWPVDRPRNWVKLVNQPTDQATTSAILNSIQRGAPFGSPDWVRKTAAKLKLGSTVRPHGRPRRPIESLSPRQRLRREKEKSSQKSK